MFGVINVYKPKGLTSHDVVSILRKILKVKQIGHTGTLDPFAEGVLPICIGKATRLIEYFDDDKEYLATINLGKATTTYDLEGEITKQSDIKIQQDKFIGCLSKFIGQINQIPPLYSAIKINGKKLYEYARSGETVKLEPRLVTIYKLDLISFDYENQVAVVKIKCSKGTYIRSIANDIGEKLGCFAYLSKLVRIQAGKFRVENSVKLPITLLPKKEEDKFIKYNINNDAKQILEYSIQNPAAGLTLPKIEIDEIDYKKVIHGISLKTKTNGLNSGDFLILIYNNHILAVGQYNGTEIKVKKVFE